jgi:glycosyltransferase involved in cell wall biosynthesis
MNSQVKLSVLMTAYNREKYIKDAIESVLLSTFTDFEL